MFFVQHIGTPLTTMALPPARLVSQAATAPPPSGGAPRVRPQMPAKDRAAVKELKFRCRIMVGIYT